MRICDYIEAMGPRAAGELTRPSDQHAADAAPPEIWLDEKAIEFGTTVGTRQDYGKPDGNAIQFSDAGGICVQLILGHIHGLWMR